MNHNANNTIFVTLNARYFNVRFIEYSIIYSTFEYEIIAGQVEVKGSQNEASKFGTKS